MRKVSAYRNYVLKILINLCLFALLYRIIYPSRIWGKFLFSSVNLVSQGFFNCSIDRMYCCYFTLATGLASVFFSQILFDILKNVAFKFKSIKRIFN